MKRGKIFLYDTYAGLLTEDEMVSLLSMTLIS